MLTMESGCHGVAEQLLNGFRKFLHHAVNSDDERNDVGADILWFGIAAGIFTCGAIFVSVKD